MEKLKFKQYYPEEGYDLYCDERLVENGKPLILLHGNGADGTFFNNQIEDFNNAGYSLYIIDSRGHGKSESGNAPISLYQFAEDLKQFMDSKGIDKASILGQSDGANVAMIFAKKYTNKVDNLILNAGNLSFDGIVEKGIILDENGNRMTANVRQFIKDSYDEALRDGNEKMAEILGLMVNEPNIDPRDLASIKAKTLVLVGEFDLITPEQTNLIASSIPNSELAILKNETHLVAIEHPKIFNDTVIEFLARCQEQAVEGKKIEDNIR